MCSSSRNKHGGTTCDIEDTDCYEQTNKQTWNMSFLWDELRPVRHLETTLISCGEVLYKIKRLINSENTCYYSVQNCYHAIFFENAMIRIYKYNTLPVVLYGYKTWSLTSRNVRKQSSQVNIWIKKTSKASFIGIDCYTNRL